MNGIQSYLEEDGSQYKMIKEESFDTVFGNKFYLTTTMHRLGLIEIDGQPWVSSMIQVIGGKGYSETLMLTFVDVCLADGRKETHSSQA